MITITSKYDLKIYKEFLKYTYKKVFILTYVSAIVLFLVGIFFAFSNVMGSFMYVFIAIMLPVLVHTYYKSIIFKAMNSPLLRNDTYQTFIFDNEGMVFKQVSNSDTYTDKYLYKEIYRVIKYKKYYFIYINRVQAFIFNNDDYINGSEHDFDELLKECMQDKYITKNTWVQKK